MDIQPFLAPDWYSIYQFLYFLVKKNNQIKQKNLKQLLRKRMSLLLISRWDRVIQHLFAKDREFNPWVDQHKQSKKNNHMEGRRV